MGGVIDLDSAHLEVVEPFLAVAGQTAPSPGITLMRRGITIQKHDVRGAAHPRTRHSSRSSHAPARHTLPRTPRC
ncbi:MAG TPA: hypothetical protein VGL13_03505, partial [Polyangiaceae bacterium]